MSYDQESFLKGLAVGRILWKPPRVIEASDTFMFSIDLTDASSLDFKIRWGTSTAAGYPGKIVDWGDGSTSGPDLTISTHTYSEHGAYRIVVKGGFFSFDVGDLGDHTQRAFVTSIDTPFNFFVPDDATTYHPMYDIDFADYTRLKRLPKGLYKRYQDIGGQIDDVTFDYCRSLEHLPDDLFRNAHFYSRPASWSRDFSFRYCTSLQEIPENLFNSTGLSELTGNYVGPSFYGCTALTKVPDRLFSKLTNCKTFGNCFAGCSGLKEVGNEVFKGCSSGLYFSGVFKNCTALEQIGAGLFDGCESATRFDEAFQNCFALKAVPSDLFDDCPDVADVRRCFKNDSAIVSAVPELWLRGTIQEPDNYECFSGCVNASNYSDIPAGWK